jgi:steroid delta-isomerase-like uncharacterized protein
MGNALDTANRFFELFAAGDLDGADDAYADDCQFVMPSGPMTKAEHRMMGEAFHAALPDAHMVVDHAVDGGDEVFIEGRFIGTHTGDMQSPGGTIPASGNKLELRFADYFRVAGGRVTEHRTYFDQADMMRQLGTLPD